MTEPNESPLNSEVNASSLRDKLQTASLEVEDEFKNTYSERSTEEYCNPKKISHLQSIDFNSHFNLSSTKANNKYSHLLVKKHTFDLSINRNNLKHKARIMHEEFNKDLTVKKADIKSKILFSKDDGQNQKKNIVKIQNPIFDKCIDKNLLKTHQGLNSNEDIYRFTINETWKQSKNGNNFLNNTNLNLNCKRMRYNTPDFISKPKHFQIKNSNNKNTRKNYSNALENDRTVQIMKNVKNQFEMELQDDNKYELKQKIKDRYKKINKHKEYYLKTIETIKNPINNGDIKVQNQ